MLTVLIRTAALWMVVTWVRLIPVSLSLTSAGGTENPSAMPMLIGLCAAPVIAGAMWIFADLLVRLALARPQQIVFDSDLSSTEWQGLAFSVVGLWYACDGLIHLVRLFSEHLYVIYSLHGGSEMSASVIGSTIPGAVFQTVLGLMLVFGARGLVGMVRRFREYGDPAVVDAGSGDGTGA
jgi:hypothetical protein